MTTDFIPLSEASRMLGLGVTTIRSWCQLGRVAAKKDSNAQWLVNLESAKSHVATAKHGATAGRRIVAKSRDGEDTSAGRKPSETTSGWVSEGGSDALAIALDALSHERRQNSELRTQNKELQSELLKLTSEIKAILGREGDGMLSRWFRK